jgi:hypothetical protein
MRTFCRNCGESEEFTNEKSRPIFCRQCGHSATGAKPPEVKVEHRQPTTPSKESADRPAPTPKAVAAAPRQIEPPKPKKWLITITDRDDQGDWKTAEIEMI